MQITQLLVMCLYAILITEPDELGVVVGLLRQQLDLPPVEELVQGGEGVLCDGTLVHVAPHLQAHQSHADIQSSVELKSYRRKDDGVSG